MNGIATSSTAAGIVVDGNELYESTKTLESDVSSQQLRLDT